MRFGGCDQLKMAETDNAATTVDFTVFPTARVGGSGRIDPNKCARCQSGRKEAQLESLNGHRLADTIV
jgi:hypothetical protein